MTNIEIKARRYIKELYFNYKEIHTTTSYMRYHEAMLLLEYLFPNSTNEESLERKWDIEWKKKL